MKKAISKSLKTLMLLSLSLFVAGTFYACRDEVDQSNRFTFTGELISTHLESRPDTYSHFVEILKKATVSKNTSGSLLKTLSTYGAYTCFAPTNPAIEAFVANEYETYLNTGVDKGITSPYVSDLSPEMCSIIAKNHIIEGEFGTIDLKDGSNIPQATMNLRYVPVDCDTVAGEIVYKLEEAEVVEEDIFTHNGIIHSLSGVLNPSRDKADEKINEISCVSIFREALKQTGLDALINKHEMDLEYDGLLDVKVEDKLSTEGSDQRYPTEKKYGFTILMEPDVVLMDKTKNSEEMVIDSWEKLAEFAEIFYGSEPGYEKEYTHPKNALFKYVAYHIIDRNLMFQDGPRSWIMETTYKRGDVDFAANPNAYGFSAAVHFTYMKNWSDYYETYLPYSNWDFTRESELDSIRDGFVPEGCMIKVSKVYEQPTTFKKTDVVLNFHNTEPPVGSKMELHTNIRVIKPEDIANDEEFKDKGISVTLPFKHPENAGIYFIDKILVYDEKDMTNYVINERMRWDIMSCFPELTTNHVRYTTTVPVTYIPLGTEYTGNKKQFCKRLRTRGNDTQFYYLYPWKGNLRGYTNYLGDEVLATGDFDFEYRIPHVPSGTYEIRMGFSMSNARGVIQFYLDDEICGIPVDMRDDIANKNRIGWFTDYKTERNNNNEEKETSSKLSASDIQDSERALRNRGYMKAPANVCVFQGSNWSYGNADAALNTRPMRDSDQAMRRIITTNQVITPKKEGHWIRVKNVTQGGDRTRQFNQDYLEIVPKSVYNNPGKPEDKF